MLSSLTGRQKSQRFHRSIYKGSSDHTYLTNEQVWSSDNLERPALTVSFLHVTCEAVG